MTCIPPNLERGKTAPKIQKGLFKGIGASSSIREKRGRKRSLPRRKGGGLRHEHSTQELGGGGGRKNVLLKVRDPNHRRSFVMGESAVSSHAKGKRKLWKRERALVKERKLII